MAFRILVTDSDCPVGDVICKGFENQSFSLICLSPGQVNWLDCQQVRDFLLKSKPAIIINTLVCGRAISQEYKQGLLNLALCCQEMDVTVIHVSSHQVFSDDDPVTLSEMDCPQPNNEQGHALLEIENAFLSTPRCVLLRLPWLIDEPSGILEKVCVALVFERKLAVSEEWRGCPMPISEVSRFIIAMVKQILCGAENWGTFHLSTSDSCSEAEFADLIARALGKAGLGVGDIFPVNRKSRLMRSNGWLVGQRCTNNFGFQLKSWRQGVKAKVDVWVEKQKRLGNLHEAPNSNDVGAPQSMG